MSVTSGFFDSLNGDRRYNAAQFSAMFDNLITDGVFVNVGTAFEVKAGTGNGVTVGVGRAWFNSAWVYNDALYSLTAQTSEMLLDRIDAVVIEINHNDAVRSGSIRIVQGSPSSNPVRPVMTNTGEVHQHPLAYIYRKGGSTSITQADITNVIGTSECPYVTGILETQDIDKIVAQWQGEFDNWFDSLDVILEGDVAANLANEVLSLQSQFHSLAKDRCVYEDLQDSTGDTILDSSGAVVEGTTSFDYSGSVTNIYVSGGDGGNTGGGEDPVTPPTDPGTVDSVFAVGDTLTTTRTNLSDKWALCNGSELDRDEYSELSSAFPFYPTGSVTETDMFGDNDNTRFGDTGYPNIGEKIVYGNGYYVATGQIRETSSSRSWANAIFYSTSPSGPWTMKKIYEYSQNPADLGGIAFGNGYFVIPYSYYPGDEQGALRIVSFQNPTDEEFNTYTMSGTLYSIDIRSVSFANDKFIVAYQTKSDISSQINLFLASTENPLSNSWTTMTVHTSTGSSSTSAFNMNNIIYVDSKYITCGNKPDDSTKVIVAAFSTLTSTFGDWEQAELDGYDTVAGIYYENYKFIVYGVSDDEYASSKSWRFSYADSPTGSWMSKNLILGTQVNGVLYANGLWYFVGSEGERSVPGELSSYEYPATIAWMADITSSTVDSRRLKVSSNRNESYTTTLYGIVSENGYLTIYGRYSYYNADSFTLDGSKLKLPEISIDDAAYTYIKVKS